MPFSGGSSSDVRQKIKASKKPVVVKFFSPNCGSCLEASPKIQQAACPYRDDVEFVEINIDQDPELADEFKVDAIPFVAAFNGGKLIKKKVGADTEEAYDRFIRRVLGGKTK
jgi:thioredoxin-like negative regulator of GroEL